MSPSIPIRDDVIHVSDENGVVSEIQQASLLGPFGDLLLEFVTGLEKLLLDASSNRTEPGEQRPK
jgi:hypothetical protein